MKALCESFVVAMFEQVEMANSERDDDGIAVLSRDCAPVLGFLQISSKRRSGMSSS